MTQYRFLRFLLAVGFALVVAGCGNPEPISPGRYLETDQLVSKIDENLAASAALSKIVDIDHSRLAQEAGSFMPPARVLIFSDAQLEAELIQQNPLVALDLPLRVLAFEDARDGASKIIYNSFDYLLSRYQLDPVSSGALQARYIGNMDAAINGIEPAAIAAFSNDAMYPDGIITITSPYGYEETIYRVNAAINIHIYTLTDFFYIHTNITAPFSPPIHTYAHTNPTTQTLTTLISPQVLHLPQNEAAVESVSQYPPPSPLRLCSNHPFNL